LGITEIYASPLLTSRRGSGHGYDVTIPTDFDADSGLREDFDLFLNELEKREWACFFDIVPNQWPPAAKIRWWMDVLENGPDSAFPLLRY